MTAPVYCPTCENMVHPTDPHSCFSAELQRAHRDAERAVIEAAKAFFQTPRLVSEAALKDAVLTIRALEGDA
jgi:hypothetical protein